MWRIIEVTGLSGAYSTRLLAEAGHDVIRVESPQGDKVRRSGPFLGNEPDLENGAYHQFLNAGKRSMMLNLQSSSGGKIFREMLKKADALVINIPLPFEEKELMEARPNLVLTKVAEEDPELCAFARSGLLSLTGHPDRQPVLLGGHLIYLAAGIYVAVATAAALWALKLTGRGQVATVSFRQCLETFVEQAMIEYTFSGTKTERRGSRGGITPISGAMPSKDGYWVISQMSKVNRWPEFMEWVQDPDLAADPTLAQEENQIKKRDFIIDRLQAWANRFTKSQLVEEGQKRAFPTSPVSTPHELAQDPQLMARGFLTEIEHPHFGRIMFPQGAIASILGNRLHLAPTLGENNAEILAELGYSERDYQALLESGAM